MSDRISTPYIKPIRKAIVVKARPARAFEAFTASVARWWLPGSSIHPERVPIEKVIFEPRVGGRWYERAIDGSETDCQVEAMMWQERQKAQQIAQAAP